MIASLVMSEGRVTWSILNFSAAQVVVLRFMVLGVATSPLHAPKVDSVISPLSHVIVVEPVVVCFCLM